LKRVVSYKKIDGLEVPASLGIPTCRDCGTQWIKSGSRDPSPELVLQLSLIALSPRRRLQEIDQILAGPQQRSA
jgi:hypothetical protein